MEYFSTGVTKDKLMVLYGLRALGVQPTKEQLSDFFVLYDLLGYFAVHNAAYELEEGGLISAVPRPYGQAYFLTPQGEETLDMFAVRLPGSLRDKISAAAQDYAPTLLSRTRFATKIERDSAGETARRVTLRAMEPHGDLLKIELLLPDEESARHACSVWEERSQTIFNAVYSELTRE
jgi:hypothetical protein